MRHYRETLIKKAGSSGLLCFWVLVAALCPALISTAGAAPLVVEVVTAEAGSGREIGQPIISFKMSDSSKKAFAEFTRRNLGRKMEIRVDGQRMSAPVIREPILGGTGQIVGPFTLQEAAGIAARLSSGTAKVEFEIID